MLRRFNNPSGVILFLSPKETNLLSFALHGASSSRASRLANSKQELYSSTYFFLGVAFLAEVFGAAGAGLAFSSACAFGVAFFGAAGFFSV